MGLSSQQETETMICGWVRIVQLAIGLESMLVVGGTEYALQCLLVTVTKISDIFISMASGSCYHLWK